MEKGVFTSRHLTTAANRGSCFAELRGAEQRIIGLVALQGGWPIGFALSRGRHDSRGIENSWENGAAHRLKLASVVVFDGHEKPMFPKDLCVPIRHLAHVQHDAL